MEKRPDYYRTEYFQRENGEIFEVEIFVITSNGGK